jgi:DNA mismatch repair protein MutS
MAEMQEAANILNNATRDSLIILDELGRGTSTFDGVSIASAIVEFIQNHLGAKTLFATHYHELTEVVKKLPRAENYCVAVSESGGRVVFLHQIVKGATSKSYGIEVARLAGLAPEIINRASEVLSSLEKNNGVETANQPAQASLALVQSVETDLPLIRLWRKKNARAAVIWITSLRAKPLAASASVAGSNLNGLFRR